MGKRWKSGLTVTELIIISVILCVVTAIVVPEYGKASTEAKEAKLIYDLQEVRSKIELYSIQHLDKLPGQGAASFADALTKYTTKEGALAAVQSPLPKVYGPYLEEVPTNLFNNKKTVTIAPVDPGQPGDAGWFLNSTTGRFRADDKLHSSSGTSHSAL